MGRPNSNYCPNEIEHQCIKCQNVHKQKVDKSYLKDVKAEVINANVLNVGGGTFSPCLPTPITSTTTITESGRYILCNSMVGNITINGKNISLDLNYKNILADTGCAINVVDSSNVQIYDAGTVVSSDDFGICFTNSTYLTLNNINIRTHEETEDAGVSAKAIRRPERGIGAFNSLNLNFSTINIENVNRDAVVLSETQDTNIKNLSVFGVRDFTAPSLFLAEDSGNVQLTDSSFYDIQSVGQEDKSIIRGNRLLDSRINNLGVFTTQVGFFSDEPIDTTFRIIDIKDSSNIESRNINVSGNQAESSGLVNLTYDNLFYGNSRDLNIDNVRINDSVIVTDDESLSSTLRGICLENTFYANLTRNSSNTLTSFDGGLKTQVIGIDINRGGEILIDNNTVNTATIYDSAGTGTITGFNFKDMETSAIVSNNTSNNNGGDADETVGFRASGESPVSNITLDTNQSNFNFGRTWVGGFFSNLDNTVFNRGQSNGNSIGTFETQGLGKSSVSKYKNKKDKLPVPYKSSAKSLVNKAEVKAKSIAAFNVNNIDPYCFGFLCTGTETREQVNVSITNCTSNNPDTDASGARVSSFKLSAKDLHKNNLNQLHVKNITKSAAFARYGIRVGRVPLPSILALSSSNITVSNASTSNNTSGVVFDEVFKGQISGGTLKQNTVAIDVDGGENINIQSNNVQESEVGVIVTALDVRVNNNTVQNSSVAGIVDDSPSPNTLLSNQSINDQNPFLSSNGVVTQKGFDAATGLFSSIAGDPTLTSLQNIVKSFRL